MRKRALLVGINDYPFGPLSGCINDVIELEKMLSKNDDGSTNYSVRTVTSDKDTITRGSLKAGIQELFNDQADMALFYFSGHGYANDLGGYLVTPDAESYDEGVSLVDVLTMANSSRAKEVIILLDSCQSGALGNIPQIDATGSMLREGIAIMTASRSTQSADEVADGGVFTKLLCAALAGGASDIVGNVSVASAYAYIDQSLGPWDQRPMFKAHLAHLEPLRVSNPDIDFNILRQLPDWFETPDSQYQLDPSYEPTDESAIEENVKIFTQMQKCRAVKLLQPVGTDHMYYAAIEGKVCELTALGKHYWRLLNEGHI